MTQEIKAYLPEQTWDELRNSLIGLTEEMGMSTISRFDILFEVSDQSNLRSISATRTTEGGLKVVVRTASASKTLQPREFALGTMGWELVNDGRIRWSRTFDRSALLYSIALMIMVVPELGYEIDKSTWFVIESDNSEIVSKHTQNLWHYKEDGKFLCLPGANALTAREAS
jgi:hypothetical protein